MDIFSRQLAEQLSLVPVKLTSWYEAFVLLARLIQGQRALLFLDEISWMASQDKTFAGQLKIVWDTHFKKNPQLLLVLCGSVSSWIDKNILNSTDFVGRISLTLDLPELPLDKCNEFFREVGEAAGRRTSAAEKFRILSVTGGVPRYLEEIDYRTTAERNVMDLCFRKGGLLVAEFDKIFSDIFTSHAPSAGTSSASS